ncbi:MAG: hypothetical protein WCF90_03035 [Methanomicrobiales archaeon]
MPNTYGSLHRAVEKIKYYMGNINRIQFDLRIDPRTVFYEVTVSEKSYNRIVQDFEEIWYLMSSIKTS